MQSGSEQPGRRVRCGRALQRVKRSRIGKLPLSMVEQTLVLAPDLVQAPSRRVSTLQAKRPMSLSFGGVDASSALGSQPHSSDLLVYRRAGRGAQRRPRSCPTRHMIGCGKTKLSGIGLRARHYGPNCSL
jgi:hypothetical protein